MFVEGHIVYHNVRERKDSLLIEVYLKDVSFCYGVHLLIRNKVFSYLGGNVVK